MNYKKDTLKNGLRVIAIVLVIVIVLGGAGIGLAWRTDYLDKWLPPNIKRMFGRGEKPAEGISVLYIHKQFSPNKETKAIKIFKSDIDGQNKVELGIGYGEDFEFLGSKDGKYFARWDERKLEVASSKQPTFFNPVAEISGANERFSNVVWANDGSKLAYMVTKRLNPNMEWGPVENKLYLIDRDGSGQKLVKRFQKPAYLSLEGLNLVKNELYWLETSTRSLAVVSLVDGSVIKRVKVGLLAYSLDFNLSSDFSKAYYLYGTKVIERDLVGDGERILYELSDVGQDEYGNESFIDRLRLSPEDDLLVFAQVNEPSNKEITYLIALSDSQVTTLLDDPRYYNVGPFFWSSGGRYLWFETFCHGCGLDKYDNEGEYYIMDMATKNMGLFFKSTRDKHSGDLNESVEFISWLVE